MKKLLLFLGVLTLAFSPASCGKEPEKAGSNYTEVFGNDGQDSPGEQGGNGEGDAQTQDPPHDVVTTGTSALELPYLISNHMVLQQRTSANIWGKANPWTEVTVKPSWTSDSFKSQTGSDGIWVVPVTTPAASFDAWTLQISDSQGGSKSVSDVLVGEVWMTTGQSNMEHPMRGFDSSTLGYQPIENYEEELAGADIPSFRYFKDKYQLSFEPCFNTKSSDWSICTPTNAREYEAVAFFFGRKLGRDLNVPIGIIGCAYGGSRIEAWMSEESLAKFPASDWKDAADLGKTGTDKQVPANIYNGMVLPAITYTVRGILWYQGESNRDNASAYPKLQQEMVRSWRALKGDTEAKIPFYYVQLASNKTSDSNAWAKMQEAQLSGLTLIPNSGIVAAYDRGGATIHYPDKRTPAERLALWAENKDYGISGTDPMGPQFVSMVTEGSSAVVTLSNASGLHLGEGSDKVMYGKIAGTNGVWYDADVTIRGDQLVFSSPSVSAPAHVRFCYADWCVGGNVYNAAGLPVFPFRN